MKSEDDAKAHPINHELRVHAEDPKLSDAQFRLLFLLATDQSRDSQNVVLANQGVLGMWTGSTRETVRNRIVAMKNLVTKNMHQVKTDLRLCTYTLHLDKTLADQAVTVSESAKHQSVADSAVTVCLEGGTMADRAVTVSETMTDAAVIYSKKDLIEIQTDDQTENETEMQTESLNEFEKIKYTEMTAESAIVLNYEASEAEPKPTLLYDDEVSRMFGI